MGAMKRTILALIVLLAGTAPASAAFFGANSPLGESFLNTGIEKVAGDVSLEVPMGCGRAWLERTAECFVAPGEINITERGLQHVLDRHVPGGLQSAGKSLFSAGEDMSTLVRQGRTVQALQQAGGNFQRIVNAGRTIGIDRATGQATSTYTIITNAAGDLITAFPGTP